MDQLKTAAFGTLFATTFVVAATFQVAMALLGVVLAFTSPGLFNANGAPASGPVQALAVVIFMLVFVLVLNAGTSALGSAIWIGVRRFLPSGRQRVPTEQPTDGVG